MAETFSVKLEGFKELAAQLKMLPPGLAKNHLRGAAVKGSTPVKQAAIELAPKKTGALQKAIYQAYIAAASTPERAVAAVGVRKTGPKGVHYGLMVELGHMTRNEAGGGKFIPPQSFLRSGFDQAQERAVQAMGERLAIGLLSEAERSKIATGG